MLVGEAWGQIGACCCGLGANWCLLLWHGANDACCCGLVQMMLVGEAWGQMMLVGVAWGQMMLVGVA